MSTGTRGNAYQGIAGKREGVANRPVVVNKDYHLKALTRYYVWKKQSNHASLWVKLIEKLRCAINDLPYIQLITFAFIQIIQ